MFRSHILAVGLLLALSAGLEAQDRPSRGDDHGPIAVLLELRRELHLSPEQVARLQRIDDETDQRNRPYLVSLRQIRNRARALGPINQLTPEKLAQFDAYMAEARPHHEKILQNSVAAMHEVRQVLSKWQRDRMLEILRNSDANRERSSSPPPSRGRIP